MTIAKTQFSPIADYSKIVQPVPLQQAPANVMPIPIGMPMPFPPAPSIEMPSFSYNSIPIALPQLDFSSWNMGLNLPMYQTSGLFGTTPNLFSSLPQIDYSQIFKNNTSFPISNTQFGSLTRPTSTTSTNTGTYTYDQATVDKLVNKYNKALSHVGDKQAFVQKLVGIANKYNADPDAMLVMMYSEGGLNPSSAGGLFGLVQSTATNYGIDINAFRNKSAIAQLDDYERILADQVKMAFGKDKPSKISGAILYAMNFTPAYVKDAINDPNHILVSANSTDSAKRYYFSQNCGKGTVADGKNYISFDTIEARLARKEHEMTALG